MEVKQGKATNSCNNCWQPIYEGEVVYTVSLTQKDASKIDSSIWGSSVGDGYNEEGWNISETWIQCAGCYYQWQEELAESKTPPINWWAWGLLIDLIVSVCILYILYRLYRSEREVQDFLRALLPIPPEIVLIAFAFVIFLLGIFLIWFVKTVFGSRPVVVNRFKLRIKEK